MTTITTSAQTDRQSYLAERSARASVFISHHALGPRTAVKSKELDALVNDVIGGDEATGRSERELAWTEFNGTASDPLSWLDAEPCHWQFYINPSNDPNGVRYIQVDLHLRTKSNVTVQSMVKLLKQTLSLRKFYIPNGVCPRLRPDGSALPSLAEAAGLTGRWLTVAGHIVFGDGKVTLYLTETHFDFEAALGKGYTEEIKKQVAKLSKRNRREKRVAQLVLRARIERKWTGTRPTSHGPISMLNEAVGFTHAWYRGRRIDTPLTHDGVFHRAIIGTHLFDENNYASRLVKGAFDGNSIGSVGLFNRLLNDADIPASIYPFVQHLDGATGTGSTPTGQHKDLIGFTKDQTDLLFFFTGPKAEVFRLGDDIFIAVDPIAPHGHLNSDKQSVLNFDILNAVNPATGLPALEDALSKLIRDMEMTLVSHDNRAIAELVGAQLDLDEDELAHLEDQFVLMDFASTFAGLNACNEEGTPIGIPEFPRLMSKMSRFIETAFMHVKRLRIRYPDGIGASGYIAPDYSILCHPDPDKNGRGFWFDQGVLGLNEFALAITTTAGRVPYTGRSVLYRRPTGTQKEGVTNANGVGRDFYLDGLNTPFLFASTSLVIVAPGGETDRYLRSVLTRSKLEKMYAYYTDPQGVIGIPWIVVILAIMGWGDDDDIVCVYGGYLATHVEAYINRTVGSMPDPERITRDAVNAIDAVVDPGLAMHLAARRARNNTPMNILLRAVDEQFGKDSNMIGKLANAGFVKRALDLMGEPVKTPLDATLARTEDVIDAFKTNTTDVSTAVVRKDMIDYWAEIQTIGRVPNFVMNCVPYKLATHETNPVVGYQTPYDDQIDRLNDHVQKFLGRLRAAYVERHRSEHEAPTEMYLGFLRNHPGDYRNISLLKGNLRSEMLACREEFVAYINLRIAEQLARFADTLAAAKAKDSDMAVRLANLISEETRFQACVKADELICSRYAPGVLEEIAVSLYNYVYDEDNAYVEVKLDDNGKVIEKIATIADGQLFQPLMGAAFRRAIVRLYAGNTTPVPPTPAPTRGGVARTAAVRNLKHSRVVNFALANATAEEKKAWYAKASSNTPVKVYILDRTVDTAMKMLHAILPDLKQDLDAVLIHIPGEAQHYGWLHRDDIAPFTTFANGQLILDGRLTVSGKAVILEVER